MVTLGPTTRLSVEMAPAIPALRRAGGKTVLAERTTNVAYDVIESKLAIPELRRDSVSRTPLVNRLRAAGAFPLVVVVAPAGYGKTTLLAQWAAKDARPFGWLSIDERDNDPVVLLRHIAAALDRIDPIDPLVSEALHSPDPPIWDAVIPRLTAHLASHDEPVVLVLDDVDLLDSDESISVVAALIKNIASGSMIALAGRAQPNLRIASVRVNSPVLEIGSYELGLSRREAEMLLRACAVELDEDEIVELVERTEGWAAGLYLAALAAREVGEEPTEERGHLAGDDRYLADYIEAEYLSQLTPELLEFLKHTSVLAKMCDALCDAVLERSDSSAMLQTIEKLNLLVVPLDRHRGWYRYHELFRELLQRKLGDEEPELVPVLNERAAAWYEAQGDPESALGHAHAAGDSDRAAQILSSIALSVHHSGRVSTVERWLRPFDDDERLERYPAVAINGCRIHAVRGRPEEAERWFGAAERGAAQHRKGVASVRPCIAVMRSAMCPDGPVQMRTDATAARTKLARGATWRPSALLVEGAAAVLLGDDAKADSIFAEAASEAERLGSAETRVIAVAERSLLASTRGDFQDAETLALEACSLVEANDLDDYSTSALALVASARSLLRHGLWDKARRQLTLAEKLVPDLTYALPWLAVQVRIELGYAYVTLRDREGALGRLEEARAILGVKPKLGVLSAGVDALADEIQDMPTNGNGGGTGLTAAELRLLPLLSTHLSFREIGARLYVSRNTIKTQAISVYRKLGVSSRSEAIDRACELGLAGPEEQLVATLWPPNGSRSVAS
jgi:LuxR family maltose regulon positive regulatory protein